MSEGRARVGDGGASSEGVAGIRDKGAISDGDSLYRRGVLGLGW